MKKEKSKKNGTLFNEKIFNINNFEILILIIIILLIQLIVIYNLSLIKFINNNTLNENNNWLSQKVENEIDVIGAENYMETTNALAGNRLNLGVWFGYHELINKNRLPVHKLDFDFLLTEYSYFSIIINKNKYGFSGFRLSVNKKFSNIFFKADSNGLFKVKKPLIFNNYLIVKDKWSHAGLIIDGRKARLSVDNFLVGEAEYKKSGNLQFGFKGSSRNVYIDNVIVNDIKSKVIFKDQFSLRNKFINYVYLLFLFAVLIDFLVISALIYFKKKLKYVLFWIIIVSINFMILAISSTIYLRWKASRYPLKESIFKQEINPFFEQINDEDTALENNSDTDSGSEEAVGFEDEKSQIIENTNSNNSDENITRDNFENSNNLKEINFGEIKNSYISDLYDSAKITIENNRKKFSIIPQPNVCRIIFVGTSQTWGSGAKDYGETFVNKIQDNLNIASVQDIKFECINASVHGMVSYQLLNIYRDYYLPFSPDITVINLSNNDASDLGSPLVFKESLENFIRLNNENNIKTLLILEPNSIEDITDNLFRYHKIMKETGKEFNIPVFDLYGFLKDNYDAGFLWWDNVHMSSAGHQLTSVFLTDKIKENIDDSMIKTINGRKYKIKTKEDMLLEKIEELSETIKKLSAKIENQGLIYEN